jgi:hypothetical protein
MWLESAPMRASFPLTRPKAFLFLIGLGIALWVALWLVAGNGIGAPWRVGGDAPYYVLLASNIASGRGYSYAGIPSAFRSPLYPLFLAGMIRFAGRHAFAAVRFLQLGLGLVSVLLLARLARRMLGPAAGRVSLLVGLFLPTVIFLPTVLMAETFAIFLTTLFLVLGAQAKWELRRFSRGLDRICGRHRNASSIQYGSARDGGDLGRGSKSGMETLDPIPGRHGGYVFGGAGAVGSTEHSGFRTATTERARRAQRAARRFLAPQGRPSRAMPSAYKQ